MPEERYASAVADFLDAQRFTRDEVSADPCPVPAEPGVYGWWFRTLPGAVDGSACVQRDGLTLLSVGISPTPPSASGKRPASQDLRKRISYHFGGGRGNASGSTLRKTLGVLLARELGLELRRIGSGRQSTFAGGEAVLTRWMAENVLVSWVVRPEPWLFEDELVTALDLPLQLHDNNAFYAELKRLRRDADVKAGKSRVLKEW